MFIFSGVFGMSDYRNIQVTDASLSFFFFLQDLAISAEELEYVLNAVLKKSKC